MRTMSLRTYDNTFAYKFVQKRNIFFFRKRIKFLKYKKINIFPEIYEFAKVSFSKVYF